MIHELRNPRFPVETVLRTATTEYVADRDGRKFYRKVFNLAGYAKFIEVQDPDTLQRLTGLYPPAAAKERVA